MLDPDSPVASTWVRIPSASAFVGTAPTRTRYPRLLPPASNRRGVGTGSPRASTPAARTPGPGWAGAGWAFNGARGAGCVGRGLVLQRSRRRVRVGRTRAGGDGDLHGPARVRVRRTAQDRRQ